MRVFNFIFFASLIGVSWCGLILHNIRDSLHSKIYGHGLHGDTNQNSHVINVNNQQQISQATAISTNHQQQQYGLNHRGDYGSLPSNDHHSYVAAGMDSNFKAGGINYHQGDSSYGSHSMGSGFGGGALHHMMKQESYKRRNGPRFGYYHDNNMFGNSQAFGASNSDESSASASSSSSSSSLGVSSSASSSSSSNSNNGERPWIGRY